MATCPEAFSRSIASASANTSAVESGSGSVRHTMVMGSQGMLSMEPYGWIPGRLRISTPPAHWAATSPKPVECSSSERWAKAIVS